jgi:hypothetical protein
MSAKFCWGVLGSVSPVRAPAENYDLGVRSSNLFGRARELSEIIS